MLETIKDATIISSNPCIEIWFLLHYIDQRAEINSADCGKALARHIPKYKKGARGNPSTEIPILINDLETEAAGK